MPFFSIVLRLAGLLGWLLMLRKPSNRPGDADMVIGPDAEDLSDGQYDFGDDDDDMSNMPAAPEVPMAIAFARPAARSSTQVKAGPASLDYERGDRWVIIADIPDLAERHLAGSVLESHGIEARLSDCEGDILCASEDVSVAVEILSATPARRYILKRE